MSVRLSPGARRIREAYPDMPIIVLTPFSKEVSRRLANEDFQALTMSFHGLGNVDLLLAIIKLLEDKMNADADINGVGVQMILLVEDSVRFYSSVLPIVYKFILKQSPRILHRGSERTRTDAAYARTPKSDARP